MEQRMKSRLLPLIAVFIWGSLSLPVLADSAGQEKAGAAIEKTSDEPLKRFDGHWQGEGKFFGMDATVQSKWEWLLAGKFLRLVVSYEMRSSDGKKQTFEGHAYYQAKGNGQYEGRWFDSQGNAYPVRATLEGNTLTSLWGEAGKADGKSTYRINEADKSLEIVDSTRQKDGSWKEFSRFRLQLNR